MPELQETGIRCQVLCECKEFQGLGLYLYPYIFTGENMTKDEALRLALEFIPSISPAFICEASHHKKHEQHASNEPCPHVAKQKQVYEAIKAALEAKDEPVAWVYPEFWQHLENLNCGTAYRLSGIGRQPLYTTPPQRTWVGLSDEEAMQICVDCGCLSEDWLVLLDAIEAKLRSKND